MINSYPEETLSQVRDSFKDKNVVIIRFEYPAEENSEVSEDVDVWWSKYVEPSWQIIAFK
jgi:hypothetical protein